jgi:hypothetical protein
MVRNRRMLPARRRAVRRDLVERARAGDRDAFATLAADSLWTEVFDVEALTAPTGRLFNIAQLMLRDRDLADDAVQETLVLAWRDLKGLRDLDVERVAFTPAVLGLSVAPQPPA